MNFSTNSIGGQLYQKAIQEGLTLPELLGHETKQSKLVKEVVVSISKCRNHSPRTRTQVKVAAVNRQINKFAAAHFLGEQHQSATFYVPYARAKVEEAVEGLMTLSPRVRNHLLSRLEDDIALHNHDVRFSRKEEQDV